MNLAKEPYPDFKRTTIRTRTYDCVFIGYAQESAIYRFVSLKNIKICESRDAVFFEDWYP